MRVLFVLFWASLLSAERIPGLFIVELNEELAKQPQRQAAIAKQDLARQMEGTGAVVVDSTEQVMNSLIVRTPTDDASALAAMPNVKKIWPVFEVTLEMDRTPALHMAREAWNLSGGIDQAGRGVKIAIVDTGIERDHPAFRDAALPVPEGYPKISRESDRECTSNKIIVCRTYAAGNGAATTPRDTIGHGTAVAMAAAGVSHSAPYGPVSGIAPKAWLGVYKAFDDNGSTSTAVLVRAIDDAVADGMDVINLSLGITPAPRPELDALIEAVENAAGRGVLVVKSAGNSGPNPNTGSSPSAAPSILTVGATLNDRFFAAAATVGSAQPYTAVPAAAPLPAAPIEGPMADVAGVDGTGLACSALPEGALAGRIALILRGDCFFEDKLINAQRAGAVAGLVFTDAERPVTVMGVGGATLPGMMVSHADGLRVKAQIAENPAVRGLLRFEGAAVPLDPRQVSTFSSRGPSDQFRIIPDLAATGEDVYTAAGTTNPGGEVYDPSGYTMVNGTSFSSPMVAGAAAVLKAFRPGLTVAQYRSLLVNSSSPLLVRGETPAGVHETGGGVLNVYNALMHTTTAEPVSLSFGAFGRTADVWRPLKVTNLSAETRHYVIDAEPSAAGPVPVSHPHDFWLGPGASLTAWLKFELFDAEPGQYQGTVFVRSGDGAQALRVPFWYGVPDYTPRFITPLNPPRTGRAGAVVNLLFRVSDVIGRSVTHWDPAIIGPNDSEIQGIQLVDEIFPGVYRARLRLGAAGANRFTIHVGDLVVPVTITAN